MLQLLLLAAAVATAAAASAPGQQQTLRIEPWGDNAIRVRASPAGRAIAEDAPGALGATAPASASSTTGSAAHPSPSGAASSGALNCTLGEDSLLRFFRGEELLLAEASPRAFGDTQYAGISNLTIAFTLESDEKI